MSERTTIGDWLVGLAMLALYGLTEPAADLLSGAMTALVQWLAGG